jgi:cell fate regulator YaaT (PSP1 superfamily)
MAMSDRGVAVGYINSFPYEAQFKKEMLPIKSISKVATAEDIKNEKDTYKKQKDTETLCQKLIEKHNLSMNLTHVEFTGYGKKVVFYFVAAARVDFRNLVRDLVSELKLRIELRQISVRDRAASTGALGPCGRELCCSSFLSKYGNVSVKMAKNQNLTLNYSKLNGVCGQLKCCLQYEDEVYSNKRKRIPDEGKFVKTNDGNSGKVLRIHLLSEQFDVLTNRGQIKRYVSNMFDKTILEVDAKMPKRFDNISDETGNVIGLTEQESIKAKNFQRDIEKLTKKTKEYAFNTFYELTGVEKPEFTYTEPEAKDENDFTNQIIMKKQVFTFALLLVFSIGFSQKWGKNSKIKLIGKTKTETRTTKVYNQITIGGAFEVTLIKGKEGEIVVTADEAILEKLIVKCTNHILEIKMENGSSYSSKIEIKIPIDEISKFSYSGSGNVNSEILPNASKFALDFSGSGKVN